MKTKPIRKPKVVKNSKFHGEALTHMREVAFGHNTTREIEDTMKYSEMLRDNGALLDAAEAKRLRKLARNKESIK